MNDSSAARQFTRAVPSLIGREGQIAELCELMDGEDCRLLTLHGPGGIGKTQLALAAGLRLGRTLHFVSLEAIEPAGSGDQAAVSAVAHAIAQTIGFRIQSTGPAPALVRDALADKNWVLVLDTFEHLLAARNYLSDLHDGAPGLQIIVTSREQLRLPNEWAMQIEGLDTKATPGRSGHSTSAAADLFISRAQEVLPDFDGHAHQDAIERLCTMLEGSPLTIKLAAGLVGERTPAEIADRLTQDLDLLRDKHGALVMRHASARAVIESGWRLLPEPERLALIRLSMFVGTFSEAAAATIAHCDAATLAQLVERNWVRLEQTRTSVRYGLHQLLQTYGQDKLANVTAATDPLAQGIQSRHAAFYHKLLLKHAPALQTMDDEAFYQIDLELHNLRLAWTWLQAGSEATDVAGFVEAMHFYFVFKGNREEAIELLEAAIAMPSVTRLERVRWGRLLTQCYYQHEFPKRSRQAGVETLAAVDAAPMTSRWQLSLALPPLAAGHLKDELFGVRPVPVEPWASDQAFIMVRLGTIGFLSAEDPVGLLSNALRTGRFSRQRLMPAGIMWSKGYLAVLFRAFGMHRLADRYARDAYTHLEQIDGDMFSFLACQSLCVSEIMAGNWTSAQHLLALRFAEADAVADWRLNQDIIALHGVIHLARGDQAVASPYWQTLADNGRKQRDPLVELWGLLGLTESRLRDGKPADAGTLARALVLEPNGTRLERARLTAARAATHWIQQDRERALELAAQALELLDGVRYLPFYSVMACRHTAEVLTAALQATAADFALRDQAVLAEKLLTRVSKANRFGQAGAALVRGDQALIQGEYRQAAQQWRQAQRHAQRFDQIGDLAAAVRRLRDPAHRAT